MEIVSIDKLGLMRIKFSEDFVLPVKQKVEKKLLIQAEPHDGQTKAMVALNWSLEELSEQGMTI